jgi:hypothetical protein
MNKCLLCFVAIPFGTIALSIAGPDKEAIITKEKAVWEAFKEKNADAVRKLVSPDVVAVYPDGIYDFQQRLESMNKIEMKSFSLSDFNVATPAAEIAIVSYKAKVEGRDGLSDLNCGTVWNLKNGEWKAVFHSDMRTEQPAK